MTTIETHPTQQQSSKKRQKSFSAVDIGTPLRPIRPRPIKQQECEQLSDWKHAS
ncbi:MULTISPECIES: hypothetical protein [Nostocales]|uniref:Uncharacterized protein n=3 Tax=Nostocales TaxID=1161 RepID=A0A8S9SWM4_9CYAN|nr:hypothetical protein [Tolypothrix bouteillei]KAF3884761.1 hypothetical protein DA73_0400004275 [Tolypothrix bouteillei VB521301]